jgi:hypothetical protein
MKYLKKLLLVLFALVITSSSLPVGAHSAQGQSTSLERGYRTGYSDGYSAGSRDIADHLARDFQNKEEYQRGDRSYNEAWGTVEDYRDGYQQGFEAGYGAGYDRRSFDSSIPTGLSRRGTSNSGAPNTPDNPADDNSNNSRQTTSTQTSGAPISGPLTISRDTMLLVELQSNLSTDVSQRGDRFQVRVIDPREFEGAIVEGRVTQVKRAGKVKGTAQLQLSFETIRLPDGRSANLNADVVELVNMNNRDGAGTVDSEGGVKGKGSTKDDVSKIGAGAGVGAIIGAVLGGGKGAAIGAVIGGTVGTASVLSKRGGDVRLDRGQQMRIRAATETRIQ